MTVIFDAKKTNPQPQLYKALMTLQVRRNLCVIADSSRSESTVCLFLAAVLRSVAVYTR